MTVHHAKTITANYIASLNEVHVEAITLSGEKVYLVVTPGGEDTFRDDVESAVLDYEDANSRRAAA